MCSSDLVEKSDFNIDNMLTTMRQYYRGGRYDFLLNSTAVSYTHLEMGFPVLSTRLPDSKKFRRDLSEERKSVCRSTI